MPTAQRDRLSPGSAHPFAEQDADPGAIAAHLLACYPDGAPAVVARLRG